MFDRSLGKPAAVLTQDRGLDSDMLAQMSAEAMSALSGSRWECVGCRGRGEIDGDITRGGVNAARCVSSVGVRGVGIKPNGLPCGQWR